jgi:hypothetical protein
VSLEQILLEQHFRLQQREYLRVDQPQCGLDITGVRGRHEGADGRARRIGARLQLHDQRFRANCLCLA